MNEYTGEKEWSLDVTPDKAGRDLLKKLGIADRLRDPKEGDFRKESFLSFRSKEMKADGTKADPIRVVDANNQPWGSDLIGNGSVVDAKFVVKDYGKGKKKGVYIRAVRVLELVPYIPQDFAPLTSDDEFFAEEATPTTKDEIARLPEGMEPVVDNNDELDDDVAL